MRFFHFRRHVPDYQQHRFRVKSRNANVSRDRLCGGDPFTKKSESSQNGSGHELHHNSPGGGGVRGIVLQLRERESDQVSEVLKWIIERAADLPPYGECIKAVETALGPRLEEEAVKAAVSGWKRKVARDIVAAMPGRFIRFCELYGGIDGYVGERQGQACALYFAMQSTNAQA